MNNIDEDIKKVKDFLKNNTWRYIELDYWEGTMMKPTKNLRQSIENILSELEKLNKSDTSKEKSSMDYYNKYKETKSKLEIYKKIAEKLAEEISCTDNYICKYFDAINECKYEARKDNTNTCKQCIIDWVRKEVTNDK